MKKKPIPEQVVIPEPIPEPEPYSLKRGGVSDIDVLNVVADKVAPIFEKYEYDFLGIARRPGSKLFPFTDYDIYDGYAIVSGSALVGDIDEKTYYLNGKGTLLIALGNDIDGADVNDIAKECAAQINGLNVPYNGGSAQIFCQAPTNGYYHTFKDGHLLAMAASSPLYHAYTRPKDANETLVNYVILPFVFGHKLTINPELTAVSPKEQTNRKDDKQTADMLELWERYNAMELRRNLNYID